MARAKVRRNSRDFYETLGVSRSASPEEIKAAFRTCAKTFHPDVNRDPSAVDRFKACNEAYETLSDPVKRAQYDRGATSFAPGPHRHGPKVSRPQPPRRPVEVPAWQADKRSIRNTIDEIKGYADKNFCLRAIYDESMTRGGDLWLMGFPSTFWAFDGAFGRAPLKAYCSEAALGFAGKIVETYNSSGSIPYPTKAVFAVFAGFPGRALLVRLLSDDVSDVQDGLWIEFESQSDNPWNDPVFTRRATTLVQLAEERAEQLSAGLAAAKGRRPGRRSSEELFCPQCDRRIAVVEGGVLPDACAVCDFDLRPFRYWPLDLGAVEPGFGRLTRRNRRS